MSATSAKARVSVTRPPSNSSRCRPGTARAAGPGGAPHPRPGRSPAPLGEDLRENSPAMAARRAGSGSRGAVRTVLPAGVASFGPEIEYPVGLGHYVEVVFDHHHG